MKSSNKSSLITGIVLLILAAVFSFSLLLQLLNFGFNTADYNNVLFLLGNMLYTAYGFSSILIPVFLLIASFSCFASKWTSQKTMRLLTALLPFFTAVITEKICRSILSQTSPKTAGIKIVIALITGLMLIVIEILGAGIIADNVNEKLFKGKKGFEPEDSENDDDSEESLAFKAEPIKKSSVFDKALSTISTVKKDEANENAEESVKNNISDEEKKDMEIEDSVPEVDEYESELNKTEEQAEEPEDDQSFNDLVKAADNLYSETIPSIEDYENLDSLNEEDNTVEAAEEDLEVSDFPVIESEDEKSKNPGPQPEPENIPAVEEIKQEEKKVEEKPEEIIEEKNPASIITQEEFAALIQPEPEIPEENEPVADELEWPNLPPAQDTLPPEYDEDFDEDDPSLKFPPEDSAEEKQEVKTQQTVEPQEPVVVDLTAPVSKSEPDESVVNKQNKYEEDNPYAAAKFVDDTVRLNPAYPIGISIHDEDIPESKPQPKRNPKTEQTVSKYPVRISLEENQEPVLSPNTINPQPVAPVSQQPVNPVVQKTVVPESVPMQKIMTQESFVQDEEPIAQYTTKPEISDDELDDDYEEDVTLPEPSFGEEFSEDKNGFLDTSIESEVIEEANFGKEEILDDDNTLDPDFFDIDMNAQEDEESTEFDENATIQSAFQETPTVREQNSPSEKQGLTAAAYDVFSEMEADIMAEQPEDEVEETYVDPYEEDSGEVLNPNSVEATNLTADELTDFFDAQQEENTPHTKEIVANPPRIGNRATKKGPYVIPSDLLTAYKDDQYWIIDEETKQASLNLKQTLFEFGIEADIIGIKKGPVVTMFELLPAPGVKLSKIVALQDNIALSLAAQSVRIVAPIPGKQAVGIEVPNRHRSVVGFREIIEMDLPEWNKMAVPVILGKDILGKAQLIDLTKTPHMLIAGATGSGKSVCVNSLILSILFKRSYKDVKLILVDPKVVELKLYNNIPHLLTPVITEPKKALQALQYCLCEMERRYALLDGLGVRDITSYNQRIKERDICAEKLPYIVVIIDEFADLMATSGKELESTVARLTAMSRAVGIHLVLATQRPSVNVITGLIKANIPSRIAFMVASRTDSNIIIDSVGAEKLLGRGDMLYASAVDPAPVRIQGTFITDQEVEDVVNAVKEYGEPDYIDDEIFVETDDEEIARDLFGDPMDDEDPLYDQALEIVVQAGKASASYIQRRLKIGYNRAARLVEEMEERGIVGPANGSKPREIIHIP